MIIVSAWLTTYNLNSESGESIKFVGKSNVIDLWKNIWYSKLNPYTIYLTCQNQKNWKKNYKLQIWHQIIFDLRTYLICFFLSWKYVGVDFTIELISIETYSPQFIGHNKIFQGSVPNLLCLLFYVWSFCSDRKALPFTIAANFFLYLIRVKLASNQSILCSNLWS